MTSEATYPDQELATRLTMCEGPRRAYRVGCGLHQLFEASVDRDPRAIAVVDPVVAWTYGELDAKANGLAHRLRSSGHGPGSRIGICLPRGVWVAEVLLGVLKAGGICVPLDPGYPAARLASMVSDAAVSAIVTPPDGGPVLPGAYEVIPLESKEAIVGGHSQRPAVELGAEALAYLIYTSGSTGEPKAVMVTHAGLVNHAQAAVELYGLTAVDRMMQISSISFDISIEEMFPIWTIGGTVVYRDDHAPIGGSDFVDDLARHRITVVDLPTALWSQWTADLGRRDAELPDCLRTVIVGGEKARTSTLAEWRRIDKGSVRWFNTYGPSEASVIATTWEAPPRWTSALGEVPLGRPIPNVDVYLLDESGQPAQSGELCIGGPGVALGYLGRPELTAERFSPNPFGREGRLYHTGDLAAWSSGGTLDYRGRADNQVKIRGFRVEPEEVAAVLLTQPDVAEALVTAAEGRDGQRRLVAYVVPRHGVEADEGVLLVYLAKRLPSYMVPSAFVRVEALPLTPNGKLDTSALPSPPQARRRLLDPPAAPSGPIEEMLVELWRDILDLDEVGVTDDFFEIGGYSIAAVWMLSELEARLGRGISMLAFFEQPTIQRLGEVIAEDFSPAPSSLQPVHPVGTKPPLLYVCTVDPGAFALRHFTRVLGPDQPVYAVILRRVPGFDRPGASLEEIAEAVLTDIRDVIPRGPYVLAGYSMGGLAAFELARRLTARGERVPLLVLLDTWSPVGTAVPRWWRLGHLLLAGGSPGARRALIRRAMGAAHGLANRRKRSNASAPRLAQTPTKPLVEDEEPDYVGEMYARYRPAPTRTPVLLVRTKTTVGRVGDPRLRWSRRLASRLRTADVGGDHGTVMREPVVHEVAELLRRELEEVAASMSP